MYLNDLNLDKIITEAIKNVIDKSRYYPIPSNIEPQRYLKMVAKQGDIPIEDLTIENNRIYKLKSKKGKKIVKHADMDFDTFYNKMVLPNNPKEAQLKSVIKQTINEVLNELDWRTYQNASQKAYQKGDKLYGDERNKSYRQGDRFRRAATNSFNRLNGYGLKNVPYGDGDKNQMQTTKNDFYVGGNIYTSQGDSFNTMSGRVNNDGEIDTAYNTQSYNKNTKNFGNNIESDNDVKKAHTLNPALKMKQMKGDKQVRDYFNSKSKYVKGKGWQ